MTGAAGWTRDFWANSGAEGIAGKVAGVAAPEGTFVASAEAANPYCLNPATDPGEPGNSDGADGADESGDRPGLPHAS